MASVPDPTVAPASGRTDLSLGPFLWLIALTLLVVALVLEPFQSFALFGSDTGEYARITATIVGTGHLPTGYAGWGSAYPDFPGIFLLAAATAGAAGTGTFEALAFSVPIVAVLSVLPLFLLFRRVFPNDTIAVLGAGFGAVAFPRIFSLAHPAPLALGDFFVVAALWMFLEGRRDRRWYLPLALTAGALVGTHHLSTYFFLVSALGSLVVLELVRPGGWSRRFPLREFLFFLVLSLGVLAYWFEFAPGFVRVASEGRLSGGTLALAAFEALAVVVVVAAALLVRWRRRGGLRTGRVRFPSDRSTVRDAALLGGGLLGGLLLLTVSALPGTTQTTSPLAVLYFAPFLVLFPLMAGTRRLVTAARDGPWLIAWLVALGLSALVALATGDPVISPARHAEYLVLPLALLIAIGLGRSVARAGDRAGRGALVAGGVVAVLLIAGNAAIAYPPPADFGGFQEGLTSGDAAIWGWAAGGLPGGTVVASDHRLSSMLFGFDGFAATWDSTPALFVGSNWTAAAAELNGSLAPHALHPLDAVAVDTTMRTHGVALNPSAPADPMSPSAAAWLRTAPFVPVYENGGDTVYWVAGPVG